jgi:hypothetical protein
MPIALPIISAAAGSIGRRRLARAPPRHQGTAARYELFGLRIPTTSELNCTWSAGQAVDSYCKQFDTQETPLPLSKEMRAKLEFPARPVASRLIS